MKSLRKFIVGILSILPLYSTIPLHAQDSPVNDVAGVNMVNQGITTKENNPSLAQSHKSNTFLTVFPLNYILGFNIGFEQKIKRKWSLAASTTAHIWFISSPNISLRADLKRYVLGDMGRGLYTRFTAVGGYFFQESAIGDHPFYAGAGIGFGGIASLSSESRWHILADVGIKLVPPLGKGALSSTAKDGSRYVYYSIFSPASLLNFSVGIAYRF